MAVTNFLGITLLEQAASDKESTVNAGFEVIDDFLEVPTFSTAATATTQRGAVSIGSGGFTGGANHFAGVAAGTQFAVNAPAGWPGALIDVQQGGVSRLRVNAAGTTELGGSLTVNGIMGATQFGGYNVPFRFNTALITFTTDANKTLTADEASRPYIDIQTDAVLTATRTLVVPLAIGNFWIVRNRNAQAIQIIGSSGTGTTIASGRIAIVICSGSNIIRVTPDQVP